MPEFLEAKLKREYPNNPRAVYGTLNNIGAMRGSKETAKGAEMQRKHDKKIGLKSMLRKRKWPALNQPYKPAERRRREG